jgi:hypothetical protein
MPGVSGGGEPPEPVTEGTSQRGRCVYWLMVWCSMSDSVLAAKKTALSKRGLLSDIGCFVSSSFVRRRQMRWRVS